MPKEDGKAGVLAMDRSSSNSPYSTLTATMVSTNEDRAASRIISSKNIGPRTIAGGHKNGSSCSISRPKQKQR